MNKKIFCLYSFVISLILIPSISTAGIWNLEIYKNEKTEYTLIKNVNLVGEYTFTLSNSVECSVSTEHVGTGFSSSVSGTAYWPSRFLTCYTKDKKVKFSMRHTSDVPVNSHEKCRNYSTLYAYDNEYSYFMNLVYSSNGN